MKKLSQYISEALRPEEMLLTAVKGNKLSKEQIVGMLSNLPVKDLQRLSARLKNEYSEYFAYEPPKDSFLKQQTKDTAIGNIADFIVKFVCA